MMYKTSEFRGTFHDPIRFTDSRGAELFEAISTRLPEVLETAGIPGQCKVDEVKSGGIFGSKSPMLIVSYPNPPTRFFQLGFVVNDNMVSFVYLGESVQNTKQNTKEQLMREGKHLRAAMVKPDEFILQQEMAWDASVMDAFKSLME